jgi:putative lysine transport system substrate-binding protein/putative lysine transport system permease protein
MALFLFCNNIIIGGIMKKLFSLVLVLLAVVLVGCNQGDFNIVDVPLEDQFRVGLEANYQPYNWMEDSRTAHNYPIENFEGKFADGYDVQIAKAVAASLGKVLVLVRLEWDALIISLENNRIDAIIAGMSPREDRKESVSFTEGYYESKHVVVVLADGKYKNANSLNSFAGATILGQQGTIYDDLVDQLVGATHGTALATVPAILNSISAGKADGTIVELPVAMGIVETNSEFAYVEIQEGFEVAEEDGIVSVAVRLGETDLVTRINAILAAITEDVRTDLMNDAIGRAPAE